MNIGMYESFITGHWFNSEAKEIWSDVATLQAWLKVEAALATAQATLGVIPVSCAAIIEEKAQARLFDTTRLAKEIGFAQHPLMPVLHQFEVLCGEPAAGFIHWGATTQNIFDTASALQMAQTHQLLIKHLDATIDCLSQTAMAHKTTPMPGRTHGQHALPMTFGFKVAGWIDELDRDRQRLCDRFATSFTASMGGAIGSFGATGKVGRDVEAQMARQLSLLPSGLPLRSSYDRVTDYTLSLGMLAGTAQKISQDIVFMQRTEIGEVAEAFHMGKVGSSTMAQKRNPSTALLLISLCRMLRGRMPLTMESMVRMDEGDSSATNVTDVLLPEIAIIGVSVAETLARLAQGLVIDTIAMHRNLDLTKGLIASETVMMGLTKLMGRHEAHHLLYEAAQKSQSEHLPYLEAIREHPVFQTHPAPTELAKWLEPTTNLGESVSITEDVVNRLSLTTRPR
jgi:3-carboxy-cis,cis-muconate cycloisomerase